jgi:transcriptional regulator with XRE-family HTH domain
MLTTHYRIPSSVLTPRLQELRLAAALSQDDLAFKAGVSRMTIARGERGEHIRLLSVRKIARALRVKPTDLYGSQPLT